MLEDSASPLRSQQLKGQDGLANSGAEENDSGEQDEEAVWQDSLRDPVLAAKLYQAIQKENRSKRRKQLATAIDKLLELEERTATSA